MVIQKFLLSAFLGAIGSIAGIVDVAQVDNALKFRDYAQVHRLLKQDALDKESVKILTGSAVASGDLALLLLLRQEGYSLSGAKLSKAIESGNVDIVRFLHQAGAPIDSEALAAAQACNAKAIKRYIIGPKWKIDPKETSRCVKNLRRRRCFGGTCSLH